MNSYYPFGLTFNSYQRVTGKRNNFLYNQGTGDITYKTERISALELNVDMTKFRVFEPAIGRWWQVDPAAEMMDQESLSPFHYGFNNSVNYSYPVGKWPWPKRIVNQANYITSKIEGAIQATEDAFDAVGDFISEQAETVGDFISSITPNIGLMRIRMVSILNQPLDLQLW